MKNYTRPDWHKTIKTYKNGSARPDWSGRLAIAVAIGFLAYLVAHLVVYVV